MRPDEGVISFEKIFLSVSDKLPSHKFEGLIVPENFNDFLNILIVTLIGIRDRSIVKKKLSL